MGDATRRARPAVASTGCRFVVSALSQAYHGDVNATADIDQGRMDGFVAEAERAARGCLSSSDPGCRSSTVPDVMGYHTQSDIPNYWAYAKAFVLQDHMFESNASWSLPAHLYTVSEWGGLLHPTRRCLQLQQRAAESRSTPGQ